MIKLWVLIIEELRSVVHDYDVGFLQNYVQ